MHVNQFEGQRSKVKVDNFAHGFHMGPSYDYVFRQSTA